LRGKWLFIFLIGEAKGCGAAGGQGDRVPHQPQEKSGQKVEKVKVCRAQLWQSLKIAKMLQNTFSLHYYPQYVKYQVLIRSFSVLLFSK
jgi:hypothetical protein